MSIYSVIAFNSAVNQMKQNEMDAQNIQAAKLKNQQAQEELDISKKLDLAKAKDARNQGTISDYIGSALEKHINEQYKPKQDILDASQQAADLKLHQAQQQNQQLGSVATQLHANDPDVQNHVSSMLQAMKQQSQPGPTGYPTDVNPQTGGESQEAQMSVAPAKIPSIIPQQFEQAPQQEQTPSQSDASMPVDQPSEAQAQDKTNAPSDTNQEGGLDLSPIEKAFGMPKGALWLNPSTGKPDVNPVWKSRMEAQQRAQANYDINQPFREEMRQDKNLKTAESYLVNSLKQRGGAIGLQNNKVDAAIHARALINQAYDPNTGNYNITQVPYGELSESMGALLSGQSGSSEGRIAALKQKTAQGDLNSAISYFTGKPSNATSQDAIKQLVDIIDRQGEVSEDLRDRAFDKMKNLPTFSRLDEDSLDALKNQHLGNSFKEFIKDAPDKQAKANIKSFANESEAEKANLPKGTIITINGRKARVN